MHSMMVNERSMGGNYDVKRRMRRRQIETGTRSTMPKSTAIRTMSAVSRRYDFKYLTDKGDSSDAADMVLQHATDYNRHGSNRERIRLVH